MARKLAKALPISGAVWIVIAALLWATDAIVRVRSLDSLDPVFLVFVEHLWIVLVLGICLLKKSWRKNLLLDDRRLYALSALIGVGGSALATILFTASFQFANPTVVILIQKLQPVMVVILARILLGEVPNRSFYGWAFLALGAATVLSWPDTASNAPRTTAWTSVWNGTLLSLGAAFLWAISTVAGRRLLTDRPVFAVTFWRFAWGALALSMGLLIFRGPTAIWDDLALTVSDRRLFTTLTYMSLGPGLIAMAAYYSGLARISASSVTFLELVFPVCAVLMNYFFLNAKLTPSQWVAGAVLLGAVTQIHRGFTRARVHRSG